SDRFLGHPNSVQTLLKLDEDTLISGCEDGVIRLLGVLPNRIIQPIAEHSDFAIEGLAFSHDRKFLGSISHDQMLKLWDLPCLLENWQKDPSTSRTSADSDDMEVDTETLKAPKVSKKKKKKKGNKGGLPNSSASDFFADL
ncbi:WD repeat-containing protein, partial [Nymphaea thermarum]